MNSCFSFRNNLLPGKEVWKDFATSFQTKLRKLNRFKTIRHTKTRLHSLLPRPLPRLKRKLRSGRSRHGVYCRSFQPVYIDELFSTRQVAASTKKVVGVSLSPKKEEKGLAPADGADEAGPSRVDVPVMMWEVDERAERFIAEFRKEMRLQRQRSFGEYMEMIARGAM